MPPRPDVLEVEVYLSGDLWQAFIAIVIQVGATPAEAFGQAVDALGPIGAEEHLDRGHLPQAPRSFFLTRKQIVKIQDAADEAQLREHAIAIAAIQQFVARHQAQER